MVHSATHSCARFVSFALDLHPQHLAGCWSHSRQSSNYCWSNIERSPILANQHDPPAPSTQTVLSEGGSGRGACLTRPTWPGTPGSGIQARGEPQASAGRSHCGLQLRPHSIPGLHCHLQGTGALSRTNGAAHLTSKHKITLLIGAFNPTKVGALAKHSLIITLSGGEQAVVQSYQGQKPEAPTSSAHPLHYELGRPQGQDKESHPSPGLIPG